MRIGVVGCGFYAQNHLHAWKDLAHVRQASFEYIEVYYNRKRIQKALGYLSPSEFEAGIDTKMALVA